MQETHQRHCPQHHRHHSVSCGEEGGGGCAILRQSSTRQKNVDSYEEEDADEHHPCDRARMRGLAWLPFVGGRGGGGGVTG